MKRNLLISYFTGTYGTKWIAEELSNELKKLGIENKTYRIDRSVNMQINYTNLFKDVDTLILIYPVYAFNLPSLIKDWLTFMPENSCDTAAIISVSGSGITKLNQASRAEAIEILQKKGIKTFYDKLLTLPSNVYANYSTNLNAAIIQKTKKLIKQSANNIAYRRIERTPINYLKYIVRITAHFQQKNRKKFRNSLIVTKDCNGCRTCASNCPVQNITMINHKPKFYCECVECFRCIYNCPQKAITSKKFKRYILPSYNIEEILNKSNLIQKPLIPEKEKMKYKGIMKYLNQ